MRSKRLAHESLRIITAFVIKITASDNLLLKDKRASFEIHSEKGHVSSHLPSHDLFRLLTNISFKSLPVENHNWKCFAIYEHEKPEICIFFFINLNLTMYSIFNKMKNHTKHYSTRNDGFTHRLHDMSVEWQSYSGHLTENSLLGQSRTGEAWGYMPCSGAPPCATTNVGRPNP